MSCPPISACWDLGPGVSAPRAQSPQQVAFLPHRPGTVPPRAQRVSYTNVGRRVSGAQKQKQPTQQKAGTDILARIFGSQCGAGGLGTRSLGYNPAAQKSSALPPLPGDLQPGRRVRGAQCTGVDRFSLSLRSCWEGPGCSSRASGRADWALCPAWGWLPAEWGDTFSGRWVRRCLKIPTPPHTEVPSYSGAHRSVRFGEEIPNNVRPGRERALPISAASLTGLSLHATP